MSDRTQTLSVGLERVEIEALLANCDHAKSWSAIINVGGEEAFPIALDKLRAALSQPEHQGDEIGNEGMEEQEALSDAAFDLQRMTEARDLCKRQTEEANHRHSQTRERLEKTQEAWRAEKKRADALLGVAQQRLEALEPPSHAEQDFGKGTSQLAAYRSGYFDARTDALDALPSSSQPHAPVLSDEERERLLDDDGPVLLSLREEVGNQIIGEGLCEGDGDHDTLGFNDPLTERIGDAISDHVKDSLDTFLRNLASREHRGEERAPETKCRRCKGTGSIAFEDYRPGEHQCHFSTTGWRCPECDGSGKKGFEHCNRCGRGNTVWHAPSPLWNAVMRGGSINGEALFNDLVCATCFMQLAERAGVASRFKVFAEQVNVELETTTPSGRVWDDERQLWTDSPQPPAGEVERLRERLLSKETIHELTKQIVEGSDGGVNQFGGGDEEDWPEEVWIQRGPTELGGGDRTLRALNAEGREAVERRGQVARRYVPATSQDSLGLEREKHKAIECAADLSAELRRERDRANKAEEERDANRADALANLDALEKHRQARERAENVPVPNLRPSTVRAAAYGYVEAWDQRVPELKEGER